MTAIVGRSLQYGLSIICTDNMVGRAAWAVEGFQKGEGRPEGEGTR